MPTHYQGDPKTEQALNTWIKLSRAFESVTSRLNQRSSMGDLTISQFGVLEILRHLGSMPQCDLAAKLLKSSGNITMVIDNLEKRGLVRREADEKDRRVSRVVLTPVGSQIIDSVFPQHAAAVRDELSVLTHEEQETLGHLLRKLGKKEV
jgi:MarR family transcriptional regulator, 2-MHQ and catechol-resistance regulon repressor